MVFLRIARNKPDLPPILFLPTIKCLLSDPKLPTDLSHSCARLRQAQGKGDLLLCELRLLHRQNLLLKILPENTDIFSGPVSREEVPTKHLIRSES